MHAKDLLTIYPMGKQTAQPDQTANVLNIPLNQEQWFTISKDFLSPTEICLLTTLFVEEKEREQLNQHPWYPYLFNQKKLDLKQTNYRIIQFQWQSKEVAFTAKEWLDAFATIFYQVVDCFFLTDTEGILIEAQGPTTYSQEEIAGMIQTLDSDFFSKTKLFIGNFYADSAAIPALYQEEASIFKEEQTTLKGKSVLSLSDVALHYFTKKKLSQSIIVTTFKETLQLDAELKKIILALWENQGNISSTAKSLFLHRNTLQYRLEKFYDQTGLSLKKMDDLIWCYLLINGE